MAMLPGEIIRWLKTLDPAQPVGIDEGGTALVIDDDDPWDGPYLEVGGLPLDEEED